MSYSNGLLLMTGESGTAGAVAAALEKNGEFTATSVCPDLSRLVKRLGTNPPHAVLVDIDPHPRETLAELEPIITRFPATRFIVLSTLRGDDLMLEAMQIGVRQFLVKQSIPTELRGVLERLIPEGAAAGSAGAVITVLSAGGGCGATTLAINLAEELRLLTSEPALVIDLDGYYGAAASYLGIEGSFGLLDVLADPARIDAQLIRSTAERHSEGLHVLIGPAAAGVADSPPMAYAHLGKAVECCRSTYGYSVIDAPRVPLEVAAGLAQRSQVTLIVFQLSVKDIRLARTLRAALLERGVSPQGIKLLANRYRRRHAMISVEEAETALGGASVYRIRNDFPSAVRGLNYGQPLSQAAPRSALRRAIRQLAVELDKERLGHTRVAASR